MPLVINSPKSLPLQMQWLDTVRLLAVVTQAGKITLVNLIPNAPIFLIHQQKSAYSTTQSSLVGCRPVAGTSEYEPDAGENYHYFGASVASSAGNKWYGEQSMIFVPSRSSITLEFNTEAPPTEDRRILIFQ